MNLAQLLYDYMNIPQAGPVTLRRIAEAFPDRDEAWRASENDLLKIGIRPDIATAIIATRSTIDPETVWNELMQNNITVTTFQDAGYPPLLATLYAPPPLILSRGLVPTEPGVAIVGTRRATSYGLAVARELGRTLAGAGITVVSGLAKGIDAAAHRGALEGNGQTIAVLGTGLDWSVFYPQENRPLAKEIINRRGALVSELPFKMEALPSSFPRRNRIIAGLCPITVVVEASEKSGALVTAQWAVDENREVWAVPGPITSEQSAGTNSLISRGATPLTRVTNILESFGMKIEVNTTPSEPITRPLPPLSAAATELFERLPTAGTASIDQLITEAGLDSASAPAAITELEMEGLVERVGAGIQRKDIY